MAHKAIYEFDGKTMLFKHLPSFAASKVSVSDQCVQIDEKTALDELPKQFPWLTSGKLVAKPDQLIKRRGINNLILLNASWDEAKAWILERMGTEVTVDDIAGVLHNFIVEPFIPHEKEDEHYLAIQSTREGDEILFYHEGGVDVGDVDAKAERLAIGVFEDIDKIDINTALLSKVDESRRPALENFIRALYKLYVEAAFALLEINPLAYVDGEFIPLDLAAKLDDTAEFESGALWGELTFPVPFSRESSDEERFIERLDSQSGSSLKFTLLQPKGRVWTMVAGGGASVIYADTVADLGFGKELANYGEYSGNPTEDETYDYARTVLDLMTREPDAEGRGKVLLIGGGIANFTDVAKTFGGICRAIRKDAEKLKAVKARIYVRRGGPNYREGLKRMRTLGEELSIPISVYGPETHMTKIVSEALAC